jgi:AmmeMemoRadiSam system protein B/AmmeMemoRadiSam system protein A
LQAAKPERVFILGFTHSGGVPGVSIPDIDAFETPLGEVKIDRAAAREMASGGQFAMVAESQVCDHSVEIQLPLLQKVRGVPVVPLYVGHLDNTERHAAAQALAQQIRPGDVLLASSDLTHYGKSFNYEPFPAGPDVDRRLFELDSRVIDAAGSLAPTLFLDTLHELHSTVCGYQPVALLLETLGLLPGEEVFQQTLDYQTSAEITGDFEHVVSYGSLGYFRADSFRLDEQAQRALLKSARETLQHLSATGERQAIPPPAASPMLMRRAPAFVSLHCGRELFGCIGRVTAETPLAEAVPNLTLDAALDDPRFAPRARVPDGIAIEISVLTPMKRIQDWRAFQLGRHGAYLESGSRSGLLLPQVASHGDYTQTSFLETLSRKAGLRPSAYQDSQSRLSVFQAQVFGDGC